MFSRRGSFQEGVVTVFSRRGSFLKGVVNFFARFLACLIRQSFTCSQVLHTLKRKSIIVRQKSRNGEHMRITNIKNRKRTKKTLAGVLIE